MDLKVGDGLYVHPYKYYPHGATEDPEWRYQVIFDGSEDGNKHIVSSLGFDYKSKEAAIEYCNSLMRDPKWKITMEVRIVSLLLLGYTARYQLDHWEEIFCNRGWSEYEKGLARQILTGQLDIKHNHVNNFSSTAADSLDSVISSCENMSKNGNDKPTKIVFNMER